MYFVDYGYTKNLLTNALARFPREFQTLPFQAVRFIIENAPKVSDSHDVIKALTIMKMLTVALGVVM